MLDDMNFSTFPIASIMFEGDYRLGLLQALSIDRLYELDAVTEYTIILNGNDNDSLERSLKRDLSSRISDKLWAKTTFVTWEDLLGDDPRVGYYDQQALKLSLGNYFESDVFLMLDAKNHFTRSSGPADFLDNGKPAMPIISTTGMWEGYVQRSLSAMDNTSADPSVMLPSITPYLMYTQEVRRTAEHLQTKYKEPLTIAMKRAGGTEFLMYYALIEPLLSTYYSNSPQPVRTLFTKWPQDPDTVQNKIAEITLESIPIFGLHRNRLPQLNARQRNSIKQMWSKNLLAPWEDADWFLSFSHVD